MSLSRHPPFLRLRFYPFQPHPIASLAYTHHSNFCNFMRTFPETERGHVFLSFLFASPSRGCHKASCFTPKQRFYAPAYLLPTSRADNGVKLKSATYLLPFLSPSRSVTTRHAHISCFPPLSGSQNALPSESIVCCFTMCHDVSPHNVVYLLSPSTCPFDVLISKTDSVYTNWSKYK